MTRLKTRRTNRKSRREMSQLTFKTLLADRSDDGRRLSIGSST